MNRKFFAFAALASVLSINAAHAADGTINFTGELLAQTCTNTINGGVSPATVVLPKISAGVLGAAGVVAGATNFTIELTKCVGTATTAAAFFEAGTGVDPITKNVRNTGAAANVQLQLLDSAGNPIKAGDTSQTDATIGTKRMTLAGGAAVLPYAVQYIATGVAGAGTVVGHVTYSINYQ